MQAQLSKLQKMFFQFSESVNAIKIDLSFSDSKQYIPTNNKKRSRRRNSRSKLLTQNTRAQTKDILKIFQAKLFQTKRLDFFLEALNLYQPLQFLAQTNPC